MRRREPLIAGYDSDWWHALSLRRVLNDDSYTRVEVQRPLQQRLVS
jgi:hypothetical protein